MTKSNLIEVTAQKTGLKKSEAEKAVNAVFEAIEEALAAGDKVLLMGFGCFEVKERCERTGRNPKTGEPMLIEASKSPSFSYGKKLKDAVNS